MLADEGVEVEARGVPSDRPVGLTEMTERFEFEVDTTKANEFWQAEVAENLARKAAEEKAAEVSSAGTA